MLYKILEQIGLDDKEAEVLVKLHEIGSTKAVILS